MIINSFSIVLVKTIRLNGIGLGTKKKDKKKREIQDNEETKIEGRSQLFCSVRTCPISFYLYDKGAFVA